MGSGSQAPREFTTKAIILGALFSGGTLFVALTVIVARVGMRKVEEHRTIGM